MKYAARAATLKHLRCLPGKSAAKAQKARMRRASKKASTRDSLSQRLGHKMDKCCSQAAFLHAQARQSIRAGRVTFRRGSHANTYMKPIGAKRPTERIHRVTANLAGDKSPEHGHGVKQASAYAAFSRCVYFVESNEAPHRPENVGGAKQRPSFSMKRSGHVTE
jgi:hypothetical protein